MKNQKYDAVVVGAGPNGLAAGITLARANRSVLIVEAKETIGGGSRSAELTLPGFVHDICSAIHPLGAGSPFFKTLPLEKFGLEWIFPPVSLAHPLEGDQAIVLEKSLEATSQKLGLDGPAYQRLMEPFVEDWDNLAGGILGPLKPPRHPVILSRFGLKALRSARGLANSQFKLDRTKGFFGGMAAHSMLALDQPTTAAFGMVLGILGHAVGWPLPRGGSQKIVDALAGYFRSLGGEIITGRTVKELTDLSPSKVVLFDLTPRQVLDITGDRFSSLYRRQLEHFRYGPGAFKLDYALSGPVPWKAEECKKAGTVHLGSSFEEIAASEKAVSKGRNPEKPFVLVSQQSLFDPTRAPEGKQTLWAYCHVPNGSTFDMTSRIEDQIERFAPGFRDLILARKVSSPADLQVYNNNYIGGDINGGLINFTQLFTRPAVRVNPYTTPDKSIYFCSSSTPPGGGVHGMCGYYAAQAALKSGLR